MIQLAILTLPMLLAAPAVAAEPSFDCDTATAPVERLICGDIELVMFDVLMAEAWGNLPPEQKKDRLADQRTWLKSRLRVCGIAAAGDGPTEDQRQAWAPCLADQFSRRLTALGVGDPPASQPADPIHPLCLLAAAHLEGKPRPVSLVTCAKAFGRVPVEIDQQSRSVRFGDLPEVLEVKAAGTLKGVGDVVTLERWMGTSYGRSSVWAVRRQGEVLSLRRLAKDGNYCSDGIDSAEVIHGDTLRITRKVEQVGMLWHIQGGAAPGTRGLGEGCHHCCFGYATFDHAIGDHEGRLVGVELFGAGDDCLSEALGTGPLTVKQAKAAVRRFRACAARAPE